MVNVVRSADGLDEAQLRWTPYDRLLPIIGVINHLTHVEWRWINGRYLAEPFPPRYEEFVLGPEVTGVEIVAAYAVVVAAPTRSCVAPLPASRNRARCEGERAGCVRVAGAPTADRSALDVLTSSKQQPRPRRSRRRDADAATAPAPTSRSARPSEAAPAPESPGGGLSVFSGTGRGDREVVPGCHDGGVRCPAWRLRVPNGVSRCPDCEVVLVDKRPARITPPMADHEQLEYDLSDFTPERREAVTFGW